jgi:hypothetical protein
MGGNFTEFLLVMAACLLVLAAAVVGIQKAIEGINTGNTMQGVYLLRTNVEQMYNGASYDGLDNTTVIDAELAPKAFVRGSELRSPFGPITISSVSDSQWQLELQDIPKSACQQLGRLAADSWGSIMVNSTEVLDDGKVSPAILISGCSQVKNNITFTTP